MSKLNPLKTEQLEHVLDLLAMVAREEKIAQVGGRVRQRLLDSAGLVECPICGGEGWYTDTALDYGVDPNDPFGEPIAVPVAIQVQCEYCQACGYVHQSPTE